MNILNHFFFRKSITNADFSFTLFGVLTFKAPSVRIIHAYMLTKKLNEVKK